MRIAKIKLLLLALILHSACVCAQDSIVPNITEIPLKFINQTNKKIDKYSNRITNKTEKTLEKLSNWEEKIRKLLNKTSPEIANQLFAEGRETFASMLAKVKEGKSLIEDTRKKYDQYQDQLSTNIKYLETQKEALDSKYIKPLTKAKQKITTLDSTVAETETAEKLIKERTKLLLTEAYKVLGKNRLLSKIGAENYTYLETLKNYRELFQDSKKAEKLALDILNRIPAAKAFMQNNSMLASLFGSPGGGASTTSLAGLQTRASVNSLIQDRIAAGGPNAAAQISQNIQAAQGELNKLKDKIAKSGNSTDADMPNFKPNEQKSKTFKQRIEIGSNMQFGKPNRYTGSQADVGLSIGYKLNSKSILGIGLSYKLDYGSISDFYMKHGGVGFRSFVDYKIKKHFFVSGGYEMNFNSSFKNFSEIRNANGTLGIGNGWQQSGLIGISKKISFPSTSGGTKGGKTKFVKGTKVQLLYDFLYNTHVVPTQPVVFRVGYNF
jgi:Mg2+ and Co2+ transporter CorA